MTEQATSVEQMPNREYGEDDPRLREEIASCKEEILRLRDLLIARDAELGAARGRLAEMEAQSGKLLNAVARLRGLLPPFVWSAVAALRRLRR